MTSDSSKAFGVFDLASAEKELLEEYIEEALEQTRTIDGILNEVASGRKNSSDLFFAVSNLIGLLVRIGSSEGYQVFGIVGHRLDEYFRSVNELPTMDIDDFHRFLEVVEDLLDFTDPIPTDASKVVRRLPAKRGFEIEDVEARNIEVMLVMLQGTVTRHVERELQQCGYRVTRVNNVLDALPTIIRTKPDFIIISGVMMELSGIDLAIGLSAMPATRNVPIALITALGESDGYLTLLPENVPIIRKGPSFADDLFKALDNLFLV